MPLHVSSRRDFLKTSLFAGASVALAGCGATSAKFLTSSAAPIRAADRPERFALLSDPHIAADPTHVRDGVNMSANAARAASEICAVAASLSGVIVSGDCAYMTGDRADYRNFANVLVHPILQKGIPLHLMMGNHDHRGHFESVLGDSFGSAAVANRCVSIIASRYANWFLLDSLGHTNEIGGEIGDEQLDWLDAALARTANTNAIIVAHHPFEDEDLFAKLGMRLRDGGKLWNVLQRHANVRAYFYGHTHRWSVERRRGIYLINLPTTAYLFNAGQPRAWTDVLLSRDAIQLRLHSIETPPRAIPHAATTLALVPSPNQIALR
ncbi:MAG TPA: metallophosphoesterase [Tepidisphaeraceae bacterium]